MTLYFGQFYRNVYRKICLRRQTTLKYSCRYLRDIRTVDVIQNKKLNNIRTLYRLVHEKTNCPFVEIWCKYGFSYMWLSLVIDRENGQSYISTFLVKGLVQHSMFSYVGWYRLAKSPRRRESP